MNLKKQLLSSIAVFLFLFGFLPFINASDIASGDCTSAFQMLKEHEMSSGTYQKGNHKSAWNKKKCVHPSAIQLVTYISYDAKQLYLHDGSIWTVSDSDTPKIFNWLPGDNVTILPSDSWFSDNQYRLKNIQTSDVVAVDIAVPPLYGNPYYRYIVSVDHSNRIILLSDGVFWKSDSWIKIKYWKPYDTIMVGENDGTWSDSYPSILINTTRNNYVESKLF